MKTTIRLFLATTFLASITPAQEAVFSDNISPEWQWSVPVESMVSSETNDHPRAFLWIPPECKRLRGVVIGQHNMEEERIFENPTFRRTLTDLDFAVIWVTPAIDLFFRFDRGSAGRFDEMLDALAAESGYSELPLVPVVPLGHSAAAGFPWNWAAWAPKRILAAISVSGQWPYYKDANTPDWGDRKVDGIPGLVTMGEYEDAWNRAGAGVKQRAEHPQLPLSMLAEPGGGHFDVSDAKVSFIALYLRKAAHHRLPKSWPINQAPVLNPIDPTKTGWLVDRVRPDGRPAAPAAPVGSYTGKTEDAFWVFDEELARATDTFQSFHAGKKVQLLGYVQKDGVVPENPKMHGQVPLRFEPEADGLTFRLRGTFVDTVPPGRPEGWSGLPAGSAIPHGTDPENIVISRICGPVEKLGVDTFSVRVYRMGVTNTKRSNEIWFFASHPGDATFRRAVLQASMRIPLANNSGADQSISFETPAVLSARAGTSLKFDARSSAGLPVRFHVREGPAYIKGDTLHLTPIPPRAKFPMKITVVAWQWGRANDPKVKTATPVERTIQLLPGRP
jgi:hypothetical protein